MKIWSKMTISGIINKHFWELSAMCRDIDKTISNSKTSEDVFQDVMVTAIKKYKTNDIAEEEGFEYLKKTLLLELHFQFKRKVKDILVFTDVVEIPNN